jgi:hypothetical protein
MPKPKTNNKNFEENIIEIERVGQNDNHENNFSSRAIEKEEPDWGNKAGEEKESQDEEDIEESLSNIYRDDNGDMIDVKKIDIKKTHWVVKLLVVLLFFGIAFGAGFWVWHKYNIPFLLQGFNPESAELTLSAPAGVYAGEEFFYTLDYKNAGKMPMTAIQIKIIYPDNFIFIDSLPSPVDGNSVWKIDSLDPGRTEEIKVKGKIIAPRGTSGMALASLSYRPGDFSSEYRKEAATQVMINDTGITLGFDDNVTALIGEESATAIKYKGDKNFLKNFRLTIDPLENMQFISNKASSSLEAKPGVWQIDDIGTDDQSLTAKFKFLKKISDTQDLVLHFEAGEDSTDGRKYYEFFTKNITVEVAQGIMNITLSINGNAKSGALNLGQELNYSIAYANKGESEMKNVIIMAVLDGDLLDWNSINDVNKGRVRGNSILWSKDQIPALASIPKGGQGNINFAIKVLPVDVVKNIKGSGEHQIKSYAQYKIGDLIDEIGASSTSTAQTASPKSDDSQSNQIVNKINSDLEIKEAVRYFDDDNIAVGFGPLPPKVGELTSFKVYWTVTNSLHDLQDVRMESILPPYVSWADKTQADNGEILFDEVNHKVIWNIKKMPRTLHQATAEFNISITPTEDQKGKVLSILPSTLVDATDTFTNETIKQSGQAKTTKLDDDPIAGVKDGQVQ